MIEEDTAYGIKKIAEPIGLIAAVIPTTKDVYKRQIYASTLQKPDIAASGKFVKDGDYWIYRYDDKTIAKNVFLKIDKKTYYFNKLGPVSYTHLHNPDPYASGYGHEVQV